MVWSFKHNTRLFCRKNVTECITGQQLLAMLYDYMRVPVSLLRSNRLNY